ncbi:hypothetical protein [Brevundimonas viscosa]|uniref:DUF5709 domain-containing protein n=1 Tax=Brevundimonas viscosa TaxID=871741 RepID=A0A1I6TDX0_9CAUL|nr:hypothetical protein [Brevundimonas viscosa]SFS87237.1 hypothetical protein SAMN05192570_3152 [Brevundimonas viscosa]
MPEIDDNGPDDQDFSEVFDEDNFDEADGGAPTNEFKTFEELPEVLDVTRAVGDADDEDSEEDVETLDEGDLDIDDELTATGVEPEADPLYGVDSPRVAEIDAGGGDLRTHDEVELVYAGLMEDVRGAQASAAHWEAKRLSDDDIADLGYGPDGDEDHPSS